MFSFEEDAMLVADREDLIALLMMRFGVIPGQMIAQIYEISDMNVLQRLILSAANAADWKVFTEEFYQGRESFKLLGENFNPLRDSLKGSERLHGKVQK